MLVVNDIAKSVARRFCTSLFWYEAAMTIALNKNGLVRRK